MAKRPTIADVAREAGVSVATVDRVLNGRLPVRSATSERIRQAAEAIGFHAAGLIRQRLREDEPEYRLGFLLQKPEQPFYQAFARIAAEATAAAAGFRGVPIVEFRSGTTPDEIADQIQRLAARCHAVALVSPDHPTVAAAVEAVCARGIPVFALLSEFAQGVREAYVGLDNRKVGRTAAWMISRAARRPGEVAVFVGSHRFHGHELREIGLRTFFREHAPEFSVIETLVNEDTAERTAEAMLDLMTGRPDLVGCYVAGGGMEGAIAALRATARSGGALPVLVCNELTPDSRAAMAEGLVTMVIDTPLRRLCPELVALMGRTIRDGSGSVQGQTFLPFDIWLPESI